MQLHTALADDVVIEYVITVPDYPRRIVGREALAELYSGYGDSIVQSGSSGVYRYYDPEKSVVTLEYTMHGTVVSTGAPGPAATRLPTVTSTRPMRPAIGARTCV